MQEWLSIGHPSLILAACALLVGLLAPDATAQYKDKCQSGKTQQDAGKYAEARKDFEAALKLASSGYLNNSARRPLT
jgi:hypothetical protein